MLWINVLSPCQHAISRPFPPLPATFLSHQLRHIQSFHPYRGRASEHDPFVVKGGVVFYDDGNSDYLVELYEEEAVGGDDPEDPALTATPCA